MKSIKKAVMIFITIFVYFNLFVCVPLVVTLPRPVGGAVLFDGVDDYIDFQNQTIEYNNFTISGWYKSTNTSASDDEYMWYHSQNTPTFGPTDDTAAKTECRFYCAGLGGTASLTGTTTITDQEWHMLTVVRSSGNYRKLYVDGIEDATTTDDGTSHTETNDQLYVGDNPGNTEQLDGWATEIVMWETVLTPAEILSMYTARKKNFALQIQPDSIIRYFPLDDHPDGTATNGLTARDLTGNVVGTWSGGESAAEDHLNY